MDSRDTLVYAFDYFGMNIMLEYLELLKFSKVKKKKKITGSKRGRGTIFERINEPRGNGLKNLWQPGWVKSEKEKILRQAK